MVMKEILKKFRNEQTLCSVYSNSSDFESFSAGVIKHVSDGWFVMAHVNPHGAFDGYTCMQTESVVKLGCGGEYMDRLAILISDGNRIYDEFKLPAYGSLLTSFLHYIKDNKEILTIELLDEYDLSLSGYITDIGSEILTVAEVNKFGEYDGTAFLNIEDISKACFASVQEVKLCKMLKRQ